MEPTWTQVVKHSLAVALAEHAARPTRGTELRLEVARYRAERLAV